MKNGLQARRTRNDSLVTFVNDKEAAYADNPAFIALAIKVRADNELSRLRIGVLLHSYCGMINNPLRAVDHL